MNSKEKAPEYASLTSKEFKEKGQFVPYSTDEIIKFIEHFQYATDNPSVSKIIVRLCNQLLAANDQIDNLGDAWPASYYTSDKG